MEKIKEYFPFNKFFENAPQPLFKGRTYEEDFEIAEGCYRHIKRIFTQLDVSYGLILSWDGVIVSHHKCVLPVRIKWMQEFRALELLRSGADRSEFLLVKEAKIIAMTCTHAALKRRDLVAAGFQYDNILMEESAQILEIETFIPLLLQVKLYSYDNYIWILSAFVWL